MKYSLLEYDRSSAIKYAEKWAYFRNPKYYNFDSLGGDCTNFASQCLYAGAKVMNYTPTTGWYYITSYNRTASWTGVEYFYNFLINNKSVGPLGIECDENDLQMGDFVQLKNGDKFTHTLLVVNKTLGDIYVSSHTRDSFNYPVSMFMFDSLRFLHITQVQTYKVKK